MFNEVIKQFVKKNRLIIRIPDRNGMGLGGDGVF